MSKRRLFLGGVGLVLLSLCTAVFWLAYEIDRFGDKDETQQADAAIVLGAAVWGDRPSPVFRERLNHAIQLYHDGYVDHIIFTGGVGYRDEISEAAMGRQYALERGVHPSHTHIEERSTNTVENLRNAQQVAQEQNLETFLIVSTPTHMKRALEIADWLGMEAYSSPTRTTRWISRFTRTRALMREVVAYTHHRLVGEGVLSDER